MKVRKRKRRAATARVEISQAGRVNEQWSMDFMQDSLCDGRRFRVLPVIDTYSRESLKIVVDTSIGGQRVTRELDQIAWVRGLPEGIIVDRIGAAALCRR